MMITIIAIKTIDAPSRPPINYQIQRKGRLGMPKGGDKRVIPKLSGGSYEARPPFFIFGGASL